MSDEHERDDVEGQGPAGEAPRRTRAARPRESFSIGAGETIKRSFSVWSRNAVAFSVLALILAAPVILSPILLDHGSTGAQIVSWFEALLGFVVSGAVAFAVFEQLRGQRPSLNESIGVGLQRFLPIIGVAILVGVTLFGPILLAFLIGMVTTPGLAVVLMVPGFVLMVVLAVSLAVAVPAAVIERPGLVGALTRSLELTKGSRFAIFAAYLLMGILGAILGAVVGAIGAIVLDVEGKLFEMLLSAVSALASSWSAVFTAVLYHDLRVGKEGISSDDLAAVFR